MKLGDKEYTPRYPIMSCIALEGTLNKSLFQVIDEITVRKMPSVAILAAIVWAGIIADEPKITQGEVLTLLDTSEPGLFRRAYAECYRTLYAAVSRLILEGAEDESEGNNITEETGKN